MSNPEIRKFKHLNTMNQILQCIKYTGEMFLGPKTTMCINHIITVEFDYLY